MTVGSVTAGSPPGQLADVRLKGMPVLQMGPPGTAEPSRPAARQALHEAYGPVEVSVAVDHCVGCLACADVCRPGALQLLPEAWAVGAAPVRCTGCRRCMPACPFGLITVSGAPRNRHQLVLDNVRDALVSLCPAGWRVYASPVPPDRILGQSLLVPDVAVVLDERNAPPWPPEDPATVSLVVEVVSPRTREADLGHKRDVYWQRGVPAYWTVDQRDGRVTVHWSVHAAWFDRWSTAVFG